MMKILVLSLLLVTVFTLQAGMRNALRNQVITDFKNAVVPSIYKQIAHMKMPDVNSENSGIKLSISGIHVDVAPFSPNQIGIQFLPGTSSIRFSASGFGIGGGATISAKWKFIKKTMRAEISTSRLGFSTQIALFSNAEKPNIRIEQLSIALSGNDVNIKISGDIVNKIINFVVNLLKGYIVSHVVSSMQSMLPGVMTNVINSCLNTLPTSMDVGPNLGLRYSFPESPAVRGDYLFTAIGAYIYAKSRPGPPPYAPKATPEFDAQNPKGIQFFMADYVIKSALDATFATGMMTLSLEKDVIGHHLKMNCKATKSPDFNFVNAVDVVLDASCNVNFDNVATNTFTLTTQLHINLREYIRAAVIFFGIGEVKFNKLEYQITNPVNIDWFKNGINQVLAAVVEVANVLLGQRGIPLPTIAGIDFTDTVEFIKNGYMEICVNPVFHFGTPAAEQDA